MIRCLFLESNWWSRMKWPLSIICTRTNWSLCMMGASRCTSDPLGLFSGGLQMFSQVGGTWEDRTDELSGWQELHFCSPGSAREKGCGIVGTRHRAVFCNPLQFCNLVFKGSNSMSTQVDGRRTWHWGLKLPTRRRVHLPHRLAHKRDGVCVMNALVPCSIFSCSTRSNKTLNHEEENQHGRPKVMTVCSPCVHVRISGVCVFLKIDPGISRALFIAVKAFNPFAPGFRWWDVWLQASGEEDRKGITEKDQCGM